jgi:hypothetical protein
VKPGELLLDDVPDDGDHLGVVLVETHGETTGAIGTVDHEDRRAALQQVRFQALWSIPRDSAQRQGWMLAAVLHARQEPGRTDEPVAGERVVDLLPGEPVAARAHALRERRVAVATDA